MKRILSIILCAALVLALVPAVFASAEESTSYTYVFKTEAFNNIGTGNVAMDATKHCFENINPDVSAPWRWVSFACGTSRQTEADKLRYSYYFDYEKDGYTGEVSGTTVTPAGFNPESTATPRFICMELQVPEGGKFNPTLDVSQFASGSILEVFLISASKAPEGGFTGSNLPTYIKTQLSLADRIGIVDTSTAGGKASWELEPRVLTKGNYYLLFLVNGANPGFTPSVGSEGYFSMSFIKSLKLSKPAEATNLGELLSYNTNSNNLKVDGFNGYVGEGVQFQDYLVKTSENSLKSTAGYVYGTTGITWYSYSALPQYNYNFINTEKSDLWSVDKISGAASSNVHPKGIFANCLYSNVSNATAKNKPFIATRVYIPYTGKYDLALKATLLNNGAGANVYFIKSTGSVPAYSDFASESNLVGTYDFWKGVDADTTEAAANKVGSVNVSEPGDYYVITQLTDNNDNTNVSVLSSKDYQSCYILGIQLTGLGADEPEENEEKARVEAIDGDPAEKESYTASRTLNVKAVDISGSDIAAIVPEKDVTGSTATVTAPKAEGYRFVCWQNNSGRVVADTEEYTFEINSEVSLLAVYAEDAAATTRVTFWAANGALLESRFVTTGQGIVLPSLPTAPGYGTAAGWMFANDTSLYGAGAQLTAEGKAMTFVAQYDPDNAESLTYVVNGENKEYAYGEKYTLTADTRKGGNGTEAFIYWEKDGKIVSFDKEYSFVAFKDGTVINAVYSDYVPAAPAIFTKIVITDMGGTDKNVMAEFIGCDDAVERGIIFGSSDSAKLGDSGVAKATAITNAPVFGASYDSGTYAIGYAILSSGKIIYSK